MATQRCGAPSTPRTEVPHGTVLTKSAMHGWMWCAASDGWPCARCGSSLVLSPWRQRAGLLAMRRAIPVDGSAERARRRTARTRAWHQRSRAESWHA
eukprot:5353011-Pleurochrysis_carterae.AAC.2